MINAKNKKKRAVICFSLITAVLLIFTLWGCNEIHFSGTYDEFTSLTETDSVLIKPAKLKEWIDADLVNNDDSFGKVVILDVSNSTSDYASGHIQGAQLWAALSDTSKRVEGPGEYSNMVADGATMDSLIQSHGIDGRTTIVITSSISSAGDTWKPSRVYFSFRYWGWPKKKLKVLDGYNGAWTTAGYSLVQDSPKITPTTYSVLENGTFNPNLRVSLSELIKAIKKKTGIPLDGRYDTVDYSTTATTGIGGTNYVVFEGQIKGGTMYDYQNYHPNAPTDFTFEDKTTIQEALGLLLKYDGTSAGVDGSKVVYTYCRTGMIAATAFFVFDAILEWPVMLYDGSWSQWGQMSSIATGKGGALIDSNSPWITDTSTLTENITYNINSRTIEAFVYTGTGLSNQVEKEDSDYMAGIGSAAPAADSGGY